MIVFKLKKCQTQLLSPRSGQYDAIKQGQNNQHSQRKEYLCKMPLVKHKPDNEELSGGESSSCESRASIKGQVATSSTASSALNLPDASEDDQKEVPTDDASSSEKNTRTSQIHTQGQTVSKRRRLQKRREGTFSFREPFLEKLRLMLDNETNANSGAIQWLDDEEGFIILDQNKFEKDIIPKYFTPIIFQSFLRKLYRWGFKRISTANSGRYKFASATFTRRSTPPINGVGSMSNFSVDPTSQLSTVPQGTLEMLLRQNVAANAQSHQLALLQRSMPIATTPSNHLGALLMNSFAQQSLPPVQIQQQIQQAQTQSILLSLVAQQLANQNRVSSMAPAIMLPPAPDHSIWSRALNTVPSQSTPSSYLGQNQLFHTNAVTHPSGEALSMLLRRAIQNAPTTAGHGVVGGAAPSSAAGADNRLIQTHDSSAQSHSERKRKFDDETESSKGEDTK